MKYLFTWNSDFLVSDAIKKWKDQFIQKYWEFNMVHIKNISENNVNFLAENILSQSFLAEKKLIIIEIEKDIKEEYINFLSTNINKIPDENIVVFSYANPDKRQKFYKLLQKETEVKEFNISSENDTFSLIKSKYWTNINDEAIRKLITYKSNNLTKIESEIVKLLITNNNINASDIIENIVPELEESIFEVVDNILNLNIPKALNNMDKILSQSNIYWLYNNLLANLRTSTYIINLKNKWISSNEITKILNLWNRWFLVNKKYKINSKQLSKLYINLINIDKKMKSGKLIWTEEIDFKLEFEKELIKAAN